MKIVALSKKTEKLPHVDTQKVKDFSSYLYEKFVSKLYHISAYKR